MGKFILKITDDQTKKDYYMEWSTVVDAPTTYGLELDEFKEYYKNQYGESGMKDLPERMERVEKTGSSGRPPYDELDDFFKFNRAGENESCIDKEGILNRYCRERVG